MLTDLLCVIRRGVAYWSTERRAREVLMLVRGRYPDARVVATDDGYAVRTGRVGLYDEALRTES